MIASLLAARAWRGFRAACRDPLAAQARCLRRILRDAADTTAAGRYGFARAARLADDRACIRAFQALVPLRTWAAMRADLDAVYAGEWRRLCPSPPRYFSMTAGSTGRYKYVPVPDAYRRAIRRASLIFTGALEAAVPGLRGLKAQFLAGSAEGGRSPSGVPQGFASGFNYRNVPALVRSRFALPYWAFTIADAEERAYAAGRMLVSEPRLGALCAISPVNLINLRSALERHAARLCDDLERGALDVRAGQAVPGTFATCPDPDRARILRAAWNRHGEFPPRLLFPDLHVLVCWQGGSMSYYLPELRRTFGVERLFEFPLSASEGVFAIPFETGRPGGAVAVTSTFLEFVPEDDGAGDAGPRTADQLEVGRDYRLVVTNPGGLYRYDIEDVVRVTGVFERTPVIAFVGKKGRPVSVSNERITERDVTAAMDAACRATGAWFPRFVFVPCSDRRWRVVVADAAPARDPAALGRFARELDAQLRRAATGYDFEREDALLEPLELVAAAPGEVAAWLERGRGDPLPNAQAKPVHLVSTFDAHRSLPAWRTHAA